MEVPLRITFRGVPSSEAIEAAVREHAERVERYVDRIIGCQVAIESHHRHHRQGRLYHVRIDLTLPGKELVVGREPDLHQEHEDVYVAIRDAFDALRRQVEDRVRIERGDVKRRVGPPSARVARVFPEQGYGFLETDEGREIYFHRHSVLGGQFDRLRVGDLVTYAEEMGEQGPQASTVHP